jgi:hypothetical protein
LRKPSLVIIQSQKWVTKYLPKETEILSPLLY